MMPSVAIVILNWNGRHYLTQFLPSVLASNYPNYTVYVADNASTDDSVEWLRTHYPDQVRIVQNANNVGFAEGYNQALQHIEADYWVLLNSDVQVSPDWIDPIIALMQAHPDIAACQPKMRCFDDPQRLEHAGAAGGWIDALGYPFCRGRILDEREMDNGQYDDTAEVAWATGAALFIRPEIYKRLGGFDSSFFAHMEEIDLCWRIRRMGYRVMTCPQSVVWHVGGGTLQKSSPFKTYLNFRNNWTMLLKNLPWAAAIWVLPLRLLLDIVALLAFVAQRDLNNAKAPLRAHAHIWRRLPNTLRQRRQTNLTIAQYRQAPDRSYAQGYYAGSIVFDFFARKKRHFSQLTTI